MTGLTIFLNGNTRDKQDLPGEKETHPRVFPDATFKNALFLVAGYSDTVIFADKGQSIVSNKVIELDRGDLLTIPDRIVHEVIEHLFEQWIGKNFDICDLQSDFKPGLGKINNCSIDTIPKILPYRSIDTYALVLSGKGNLALDNPDQFLYLIEKFCPFFGFSVAFAISTHPNSPVIVLRISWRVILLSRLSFLLARRIASSAWYRSVISRITP